jgi:hypothetical protein
MTHTAGFEEELRAMLARDLAEVLPLREFLVRAMPQRIYPPGEVFAYSNYGTALAGYLVERVSGTSYERYVTEHLLQPLGMARSAALQPLPPALRTDMSKGYHVGRNGRYDALDFEWAAAAPAAPIRGTATDLAQFMIAHLYGGCVEGRCILRPETVAEMHRQQFTHHPALTGMAYGFVESQMNGQRILWHMGESARFVTVLALLPQEGVGLLVSYNTPPQDGRAILFRFLDEFYPVDRPTQAPSPLPGWNERAREMGGVYVPSRVALYSPQKIVGWLGTLPVRASADGTLTLGPQRYVEIEPWLFDQQGGDRELSIQQKGGQTWLFWGPFAYWKAAWYQTLTFHGALLAVCALVFVSGWLAWPLVSWINARRGDARRGRTLSVGVRRARWLAAALGLLDLGLLAWFLRLMVAYGETYAFPARAVDLVTRLNWLAAPLTLAVLVMAVRSWRQHKTHWICQVHYTLVAVAGIAFLWFLGFWNLLAGLPL